MMQSEVQLQPTGSQKLSGSDEIKAEDLERGSASSLCCRICLENDSGNDELISPCMCKGTQEFVHCSCLDHWRSLKGGFAFSNCTTCNAQFHLPDEQPFDGNNSWRQRLIDAWWVFLMLLIVQPAVAVMAGGAY